ncbi:MAG: matrixin family metalloprotease [Acidobacteriaceae bacterium]|nr:matrixin family metalloprotease [Acidobacteriaceae bacterium]
MFRAGLLAALFVYAAFGASTEQTNWSGPYHPCANRGELTKPGHMRLGVRFDTNSSQIALAVRRALTFWSLILDMSFYEEPTAACAVAVVDGTPAILRDNNNVARSQFTDLPNFQGWVAFDPHAGEYMSNEEMYATAVHELGHLFGLRHNPRASSIMYYLDCDGTSLLDERDLQTLALRHAMRTGLHKAVPIVQ